MTSLTVPESAYTETKGMRYFARMLSKIRFFAQGTLREDFHDNLGKGADGWCCSHLGIDYDQLKVRVLEGGSNSNEEILDWCYAHGRALSDKDIFIWNNFVSKLGWNDSISDTLKRRKAESGLSDRNDIQTMSEYFEYDEGRKH